MQTEYNKWGSRDLGEVFRKSYLLMPGVEHKVNFLKVTPDPLRDGVFATCQFCGCRGFVSKVEIMSITRMRDETAVDWENGSDRC
jgi:hypothetical protein